MRRRGNRRCPLIDRDQFHGKFCAEVDFKNGVETMRFANGKAEYDRIGAVALFPDSRHVPVLNARNAVHRFCRRSEPRPADGHSAANRFRRLVCAEFRHHDQVLFPVRDIGEDMCAVGRYRALAVLIGNKCRRQGGIFPCAEGNAFRFEFSVEFRNQICRIHLVFRLSVFDCCRELCHKFERNQAFSPFKFGKTAIMQYSTRLR